MKTNSVDILETVNSGLSCKKEFWAAFSAYSNIQYWQADMNTPGTGTPEAVHIGRQRMPILHHKTARKYLQTGTKSKSRL